MIRGRENVPNHLRSCVPGFPDSGSFELIANRILEILRRRGRRLWLSLPGNFIVHRGLVVRHQRHPSSISRDARPCPSRSLSWLDAQRPLTLSGSAARQSAIPCIPALI
jgi:hypothetical protein